jgi:drug/metabolite transporter (DMT)-like permease
MRWTALVMVLISTVTHAGWSFHVKRVADRRLFLWCMIATAALGASPVAIHEVARHPPSWPVIACILGTGLVYCAYFPLTALSYERADLSRAYPIARGVALLLTVCWGFLFFGERPTWAGRGGIALVLLGLALLARVSPGNRAGVVAAIGTGFCTSLYSAIDKRGVTLWDPAAYLGCTFAVAAAGWGMAIARDQGAGSMARYARRHWRGIGLCAALCLGGYLLVLKAFTQAPVGYVVTIRSVSVLLTVLAGTHLLGEAEKARRMLAALGIIAGVALIMLHG